MNHSILLILVPCLFLHVRGQESALPPPPGAIHPFHPSALLILGIILGMVGLTLFLLAYLKFCNAYLLDGFALTTANPNLNGTTVQPRSIFSGVDRTTIESIPFFHFSALKGSKQGLECAICISKFEDSDVLRLLPKCKHAFHISCIDQWLETHTTCPLCRYKFDARDLRSFSNRLNSFRLSQNASNLTEDPNIELFVERQQDDHDHVHVQGSSSSSSSRFSNIIGSSFRGIDKGKKQELLIQEDEHDGKVMHKFKHKIIVSDAVIKSRWSDVSPSDLLSLNSEMLRAMSSRRFSSLESNSSSRRLRIGLSKSEQIEKVKDDLERKRLFESKLINDPSSSSPSTNLYNNEESNSSNKRSVSEITVFSRLRQFSLKTQISMLSNNGKEERIRRLWLPMVRKTVQWFSRQERYVDESDNKRQQRPNV